MTRSFEIRATDSNRRVDHVLVDAFPEFSRSLVQRLIIDKRVTVAGESVKASHKVHAGDAIDVDVVFPPSLSAAPEPIELTVVYEDESMAVLDKPAGLVVHPAPGHVGGTLVNALVHRYPRLAVSGEIRPGIVHRLDKDTSGLMVVALTPKAHVNLSQQIKSRTMRREYLALIPGHPDRNEYTIDAAIGRDERTRLRMAVGPNTIRPRPARTRFRAETYFDEFTLVRVVLDSGRTHQIRVHLAYAGFPVVGDTLYGGRALTHLTRQFLHAAALEVDAPVGGERLRFESRLPLELDAILGQLTNSDVDHT